MEKLYFEDFQPGMRFETATRTLTADDIAGFARQHDPQPFHLDARLAEHSVFAGLAASGWQTATTSMRLVVDLLADRVAGGLVGMQVDKMRWPRPTRPGDTLKVTLEVLKTKRSTTQPEFGVVGWRWITTNQAGETAMTLENAIWVPCRPH
ncbi:MaoC [Laribacter hongkongensis HLHK9]|uniref:MaoC n=1 Tax=Laribacter hongkongensis (strain HLHK9) TaxID=557598 RepID=C1D8N9_LARHH|nr:MaoC family dehydratase [Laribacter hongkongensis]ACO74829.1 MaoC [Laribacter hongkongensis HLHK9]